MFGYVFHDRNGQNHGRKLRIPWYLLNEIYTGIHQPDYNGKDCSSKLFWNLDGRKNAELGKYVRSSQTRLISVSCLDDHQFKKEELESVGELSEVCSQTVLKCLYLARIGRPDILWSVNKLARSVAKNGLEHVTNDKQG